MPAVATMATGIDLLSISWERAFRDGMTAAEQARYDAGKMTLKETRDVRTHL